MKQYASHGKRNNNLVLKGNYYYLFMLVKNIASVKG